MKGDAPAALSHLEATRTFLEDLGFVGRRRDVCPDLVRLAVSEGRHGLARSAAGSLEELVALDPIPSVRGAACRCEGFLSEKPEPHLKAVECYRASGRPLETALSCESAGEAVVKGGGSEGIALITEAAVIFESLGATQDIARVERMLRALGVKRGAKGQRRRPKTGWDSLTKTEQQVARLAAEGLTNPQIGARLYVSRRTVATHLSHIYQKLGIASRVELAAASANKATEAPAT
jgi:DNA-binding CsgD family transcriptional regulator